MSSDISFDGDHFSKQANDYSLYRPRYPQSLFVYLGTLTAQHEMAWDCATGNGQAAVALASIYKSVEASDASERQIEQAIPHTNVRYQVSEATSTLFTDNSFDLITVAQAMHWFELENFYKEVTRVSKPGGVFAAWCYGLFTVNPDIDKHIKNFYRQTIGPFWPEGRQYIDDGYATLDFPFERIDAPDFSMTANWNLQQVLGYMGTWSAVQYYREQHQQDPVKLLAAELEPAWGNPQQTLKISWPLFLHIGRVNK